MASLYRANGQPCSPILAFLCLFCIFTSTAWAASAVLGVDLGTEYIKAALVKPGIPLEIVLTKDSRRKEASVVAFKPVKEPQPGAFPERVYGSDALALAARFPGDVYPNLKALLGLPADNSIATEYASRHPALQLEVEKTRGTAAFRSGSFAADEQSFSVEELLAMELQSIQRNAEALAGSRVQDVVLTVPPFYTAEEKRAVRLAAELAGLRILEMISDGLAVGLNYATSRTFPTVNEGGKAEVHMVFDMGAGSTKATVLKFQARTVKDVGKFNKTIQEVQVLGTGWDRTLGGDALNTIIVDDMLAQFVESKAAKAASTSVEAVKAHGRASAKLWKEAERLRQVLSANTNTQASFEGLYDDIDFRYKVSRADFEKKAEPYAARIAPAMQKALDEAGLVVADIHSIILHGGAIRTPFVQKEIEKFVGNPDKVRTNVNADESAVFGAGFRGAGLSPSFRVKEIRSSESASYAAGIRWTSTFKKPQHQRLWRPTSHLGQTKHVSFKNQEDPFSITFYQDVPLSENISDDGFTDKGLLRLTTQNLTDSVNQLRTKYGCDDAGINLQVSTRLSPVDGEVEIVKVVVDCEVEDAKAGIVDGVKGLFGFGKKDQAPLSDAGEETLDTAQETFEADAESSSTSASTSSTSTSAAAEESQETKAKPTKHLEAIPVQYTAEVLGRPEMPAPERSRMRDRLSAFDDSDRSRRLREEALNQLEGFTYKARDLLENDEFVAASTKEERSVLEAKAKAASEWIYSEGSDATRDELKAKLKEMRDIVYPVEQRREEAASRPEALELLQKAIDGMKNAIESVTGQIENDTKLHSAFSASKLSSATSSASSSSTTTSSVDDFADLEDDATTTTSSAPAEEETLDPPVYTTDDLLAPEELYSAAVSWLAEKSSAQEKLAPTAEPILLVKDLTARAKELTDARKVLISKRVARLTKPKKPSKSAKSGSTGKKKSGGAAKSKTSSAAKAAPSLDFGSDGPQPPIFTFGEDGSFDNEEFLAFLEQQEAELKQDMGKGKEEGAEQPVSGKGDNGDGEAPVAEADADSKARSRDEL